MERTYVEILSYLNYDIESAMKKIDAQDHVDKNMKELIAKEIISQAEEECYYDFSGNILIIVDRLFEVAISLSYFFNKCSNANVLGVATSYQSAMFVAGEHPIDYLIFVGYQKDHDNYRVIRQLREQENSPHIVIWAALDQCIRYVCMNYKIYESFDRERPVREFIDFLKGLKRVPAPLKPKLENRTVSIDKLNKEKKEFFRLCSKQDKKKIEGSIEMPYEDFERMRYILEYLKLYELSADLFNKNFIKFKEKMSEKESYLLLSEMDDEGRVTIHTRWLIGFYLSAPNKKSKRLLENILEID